VTVTLAVAVTVQIACCKVHAMDTQQYGGFAYLQDMQPIGASDRQSLMSLVDSYLIIIISALLQMLFDFTAGTSRPGGSNVVKDALSGFATRFRTGGTALHNSLTQAEDYGVGGAAVVSNKSSSAATGSSGGSKP
jgi:hypothetical protein